MTQLQSLQLMGSKVSDAGLQHLKGLTQLQRLDLDGTQVSDAGLNHLKGLTQLRELNLRGTKVTSGCKGTSAGITGMQDSSLTRAIRPPNPLVSAPTSATRLCLAAPLAPPLSVPQTLRNNTVSVP